MESHDLGSSIVAKSMYYLQLHQSLVSFSVFGSALHALPLGLVMERVFGVTVCG